MTAASIVTSDNGFRIMGHVGFYNAVRLRKEGDAALLHCQSPVIIVDLSAMHDDNAVTLSLLLSWMRHARAQQKKIQFTQLSPSLLRMATLFGIAGFI